MTQDVAITVAIYSLCGVIAGSMITSVFQYLQSRTLNNTSASKTKADTAALYQEISSIAAEKALRTEERITALEAALEVKDRRIDELEAANSEKDKKIIGLQCEVNELRAKIALLEAK